MANARLISGIKGPADPMNAFMAIGDSITIGLPTNFGGYRSKLNAAAPKMVFQGRNDNTGLHEGYNGFRTDQVSPIVLPAVPLLQPRCFLVMLGVNDINQGETPADTLVEVRAFAEALLVASPYVTHVFVTDIPIGITMNSLGGSAFNSGLAAAFSGADSRIITCSTCSRLVIGTDFTDGLHPNELGYQKMADDWLPVLRSVFPTL